MSERTNTDDDVIRKQQERDVGHPLDRDERDQAAGRKAEKGELPPDKGEDERRRRG